MGNNCTDFLLKQENLRWAPLKDPLKIYRKPGRPIFPGGPRLKFGYGVPLLFMTKSLKIMENWYHVYNFPVKMRDFQTLFKKNLRKSLKGGTCPYSLCMRIHHPTPPPTPPPPPGLFYDYMFFGDHGTNWCKVFLPIKFLTTTACNFRIRTISNCLPVKYIHILKLLRPSRSRRSSTFSIIHGFTVYKLLKNNRPHPCRWSITKTIIPYLFVGNHSFRLISTY